MRWGLVLVLVVVAIVIAMRCRSDQSTHQRATPTAQSARVKRVDPKVRVAIEGTVTDGAAPLAGAFVCADTEIDVELPCVLTDARGAFAISGLRPDRYTVVVSLATFKPKRSEPIELTVKTETVQIELERGGVEISGTVYDHGGGPIAKARVSTRDAITETRDDGSFSLWVAGNQAFLITSAEGYAVARRSVDAPARIELFLIPEGTISGSVVDAVTHEPIEGAGVVVVGEYAAPVDVMTDERGAFRATRLAPGRYEVSAHTEHGYGLLAGSLLVGVGTNVGNIEIGLHPASLVTAKILMSTTRQPCAKATLQLVDVDKNRRVVMQDRDDGRLVAEAVLPGTYAVHLSCRDGVSRENYPNVVVGSSDVSAEFEVDPGARISGRIRTAKGTPLDGVFVSVSKTHAPGEKWWPMRYTHTDGAGRYELAGLPSGTFKLRHHADDTFDVRPKDPAELVVSAGATTERDFVVEDPGAIEGRVVDRDGKPIDNVSVIMDQGNEDIANSASTDADGRFVMRRVRAGEYFVTAQQSTLLDSKKVRDRVTVRANQTATPVLTLEQDAGVISGVVTEADGKPAGDVFITLRRFKDGRPDDVLDARPIMTAPDGSFTATRLPLGDTYTVRAFRKGGASGVAENVPTGGVAKIQLRKLGSISGSVRSWNTPLDELSISASSERGESRYSKLFRTNGAFTLDDLPGGHYTLNVGSEGKSARLEVDLADGEHKNGIVIELAALVTVTGRVVERGTVRPIAKVTVDAQATGGRTGYALGYDANDHGNVTDGNGRFTIKRVPLGKVMFTPRLQGYQELYVVRSVAGTNVVDIGDIPIIASPEGGGDTGLSFVDDDSGPLETAKLVVKAVKPNSAAALAGIVAGDIITSVDGIDMTGYGTMNVYPVFYRSPPGTKLSIRLARGVTVDIVLAKSRD